MIKRSFISDLDKRAECDDLVEDEGDNQPTGHIRKCYLSGFIITMLLGFIQFGWQQGAWNVILTPY